MISRTALLILAISFFLPAHLLFAQPSGMRPKPGMGMREWRKGEPCSKALDLDLSPEQSRMLEIIQHSHFREIRLPRGELFLKRLELRELLTNPSAKPDLIRSKYAEFNDLQTKFEGRIMDYVINIRSILTSEQLKAWCPEQEIPFFHWMSPGGEMMGPRPGRRPHFNGESKKE